MSETSKYNGLAAWRQRQADERRLRLLELEHYRSYATTEERDGRVYTVVRVPDRYDFGVKPLVQPVQLRSKRRQAA